MGAFSPNKLTWGVTLLTCIQDILGSSILAKTVRGVSQSLQGPTGTVYKNRWWRICPVLQSPPNTIPFDAN